MCRKVGLLLLGKKVVPIYGKGRPWILGNSNNWHFEVPLVTIPISEAPAASSARGV